MREGRVIFVTGTTGLGVVFALIAFGIYLLGVTARAPDLGRNTFGNPAIEDLLEQCRLSASGATVRLYRGNGGATTEFSYSVTFQAGSQKPEQQFFYAYGAPAIEHIECKNGEVTLVFLDGDTRTIFASQITNFLLNRPIGFHNGKSIAPPSPSLVPDWAWPTALAVLMIAISLIALFTSNPKSSSR
jgi:hypothetical protein